MTKKSPTDLMCYQNYTLKENFCFCSWKAGEDSEHARYTFLYWKQDELQWQTFDAKNQTHYILKNDEVHMKKNISLAVAAYEEEQEYRSSTFSVILDKAVKLDPPDQKSVTIEKKHSYVSIHWTRIDRFSDSMETIKEVQNKINEHSPTMDCRALTKTNNSPNCIPEEETELPICQESCTIVLDGHKGHHIQIRQRYKEGVWSEWSDPLFVPADIGSKLEARYKSGQLDDTGTRGINLMWQASTEEQGDMKYDISLTLLSCPNVTVHNQTKVNLFYSRISGASYNVTVTASNQAEKATTWSSVIEGNWAGKPFKSVNLSGNNLIMNWEGKITEETRYCIEWKSTTGKEVIFSNLTGNYERNQLIIPTGSFYPMQCYRISVHKLDIFQKTMGTTYYFQPLLTVGPRNLTVVNVTAHSVLLKWDAFDLHECQQVLENWIINLTDHKTNISRGEISENSSVTQYLVQDLPLGFNYTFEVKGVTVYGEQTGSSIKSVSSPGTDLNMWIFGKILLIFLAVLVVVVLMCFVVKRFIKPLFVDLPNPSNSNAITFVSLDNKYILCPKQHIDTSSEDNYADPLMIVPTVETEANKVAIRETEITNVVITKQLSNNEHVVMTEADTDFQFEYRKQVVSTTPGSEKETVIQFFGNLKDDLAHQAELPIEIDALLIHNEHMTSFLES